MGLCSIPDESVYHGPLAFLQQACEFIAAELASDKIGTCTTQHHIHTLLSTPIRPLICRCARCYPPPDPWVCPLRRMCVVIVVAEMDKWSSVFSWMDEDAGSKTYFELVTEAPRCMGPIAAAASKTYARGLVIVLLYFEGAFYVVLEDGEGDQPLLVRTP